MTTAAAGCPQMRRHHHLRLGFFASILSSISKHRGAAYLAVTVAVGVAAASPSSSSPPPQRLWSRVKEGSEEVASEEGYPNSHRTIAIHRTPRRRAKSSAFVEHRNSRDGGMMTATTATSASPQQTTEKTPVKGKGKGQKQRVQAQAQKKNRAQTKAQTQWKHPPAVIIDPFSMVLRPTPDPLSLEYAYSVLRLAEGVIESGIASMSDPNDGGLELMYVSLSLLDVTWFDGDDGDDKDDSGGVRRRYLLEKEPYTVIRSRYWGGYAHFSPPPPQLQPTSLCLCLRPRHSDLRYRLSPPRLIFSS